MRKISKELEDLIKKVFLSDKKIYLAINMVNSYISNKELLDNNDQVCLENLKDMFNSSNLKLVVKQVKNKLKKIFLEDDYFNANVYLKPKKIKENGEVAYRPIHSASLVDQISMVVLLIHLMYKINRNKIEPSQFAKLLPKNFYGNKISYDGKNLFEPWNNQYKLYCQDANDSLLEYIDTLEYATEIDLDLINFYPSVNPLKLYKHLKNNFPLEISNQEKELLCEVIKKLIFIKINISSKEVIKEYLGVENNDLKNELIFAKGIPQGLPHSAFFANMYMLLIEKEFNKVFDGKMIFYVDDSIIFIKESLKDDTFADKIKQLNINLNKMEQNLICEDDFFPQNYNYCDSDFGVKVHEAGENSKSKYNLIKNYNENYKGILIRTLSRETSNINSDLYNYYSDEELASISNKVEKILILITNEIYSIKNNSNKTYLKRLKRYKKFFEYRKDLIDIRQNTDVTSLYRKFRDCTKKFIDNVEELVDIINNEVLLIEISLLIKNLNINDSRYKEVLSKLYSIDKTITKNKFNEGENTYSYLKKLYNNYLSIIDVNKTNIYSTLEILVSNKLLKFNNKNEKNKLELLSNALQKNNLKEYLKFLNFDIDLKKYSIIMANNNVLERMILNSIFSAMFNYYIDDTYNFCKKSKMASNYFEFHLLAVLRHDSCTYDDFRKAFNEYKEEFYDSIDYSLLQVLDIFKTHVIEIKYIQDLIKIHRYCCETWKNGSKYLHFYTLHNQEHAVVLIKSAIKLIKLIAFFNVKKDEYFILFAACYLHDISMVTVPDSSQFCSINNKEANQLCISFKNRISEKHGHEINAECYNLYQSIDSLLETMVRSKHATNSANEILKFKELDFLDNLVREKIAEVSRAHCYDAPDVYYEKSKTDRNLINLKNIKIILRISDLLDMSKYRISPVILKHNLKGLSETSRFHWISHLLTDDYELSNEYIIDDENKLIEKTVLNVNILMHQTTKIETNNKCINIKSAKFNENNGYNLIYKSDVNKICEEQECSFICKCFTLKNHYLFLEIATLKEYLNSIKSNYFKSDFEIKLTLSPNNYMDQEVFDYLKKYIEKNAENNDQ